MWPRISRFERRIIAAIFLSALVPFLISLAFIPQIIETRLALSMHSDVKAQLEASAVFYKEFFDAKKREYSARAEAHGPGSGAHRAAQESRQDEVQARLQQVLDDNPEIRSLAVIDPTGRASWCGSTGPRGARAPTSYRRPSPSPWGWARPPGSRRSSSCRSLYMVERAHAEEIATLYDASLRTEDQRSRTLYHGPTSPSPSR
jgi:hypothetical protein